MQGGCDIWGATYTGVRSIRQLQLSLTSGLPFPPISTHGRVQFWNSAALASSGTKWNLGHLNTVRPNKYSTLTSVGSSQQSVLSAHHFSSARKYIWILFFVGVLILLINKVLNFHFSSMTLMHVIELFIRPNFKPLVGIVVDFCRKKEFRSGKVTFFFILINFTII